MRNQLENIELIEKYINGELSMEEKQNFESQLQNDAEFKQQFETQKLLQKAIQRAALRKEVLTAKNSGNNFKYGKWIAGGLLLLIGASVFWVLTQHQTTEKDNQDKKPSLFVSKNSVIPKTNTTESANIVDSNVKLNENSEAVESINSSVFDDENNTTTSQTQVALVNKEDNKKAEAVNEEEKFKLADFKQKTQTFVIKGDRDTVIFGKEGVSIQIPANSFDTKAKVPIEIRLKEFLELSDMLLEGHTTTSNNELIETSGMIHLEAFQGGKKVNLKLDKPIRIAFPTPENDKGFILFDGEQSKNDKTINWIPQEEKSATINELNKVGLSCSAFSYSFPKFLYKEVDSLYMNGLMSLFKSNKSSFTDLNSQKEDNLYFNQGVICAPITENENGLLKRGDIELLGKFYEQALDSGCLPTGIISFYLNGFEKAYDFKYTSNDNCADSIFYKISQISRWHVGTPNVILVEFPRSRVAILDLNYLNYINHPDFGKKISDLMARNQLTRPDVSKFSVFSTLKLSWINCDRFVGKGRELSDFNVTAPEFSQTFLVYKRLKSILPPSKRNGESFQFPNVPHNEPIVLVTMLENEDGVFAKKEELIFDGTDYKMGEPDKMTKEEFVAFVKSLNKVNKK